MTLKTRTDDNLQSDDEDGSGNEVITDLPHTVAPEPNPARPVQCTCVSGSPCTVHRASW